MIHRMLMKKWLACRIVCLVTTVFGLGIAASAQDARDGKTAGPEKPEFMSRYDFHITISSLSSNDRRFGWIGRVGGDMDLVDYVKGRTSLFAEYEVVMGDELRPFDPNQGNYTFDGSTSWRIRGTEFAGVFHHLSRHLSDRPKTEAVAINSVEGWVLRSFTAGKGSVDVRAGAGKVVQRSFLDYTWRTHGRVTARRPLTSVVGLFGHGAVETFGVDRGIANRGAQTGGRIEAGLRLGGKRGAIELFGGWEHVVDAYPLERIGRNWAFVGFRLASR
jgi:hypothetical protein